MRLVEPTRKAIFGPDQSSLNEKPTAPRAVGFRPQSRYRSCRSSSTFRICVPVAPTSTIGVVKRGPVHAVRRHR